MVKHVLGKKVFREVKQNIKQYISVILIAALAVTLFTGLLANYYHFRNRVDIAYDGGNVADIYLTVDKYSKIDHDALKKENEIVEKRFFTGGKADTASLYVIVAPAENTMNVPSQTSLNRPIEDGDVYVDELLLEKLNIEIGDSLEISIGGVDETLTFQINGTMLHPEGLSNTKSTPSLIYITRGALEEQIKIVYPTTYPFVITMLEAHYNQFLVRTMDIEKTMQSAIAHFEKSNTTLLYNLTIEDMPCTKAIEADITQAKQLLYVFPVIFYLVGVLIILTSISQLVARERMNIGIMKAMGYSKREITNHYVMVGVVLSLIGSIIGIILGPLILPNVMNVKYNILYALPSSPLPFFKVEYLFSVLILVVICLLVAYFTTSAEIKRKPAESIRGDNFLKIRPLLIEKTKLGKKFPLTLKMAFRNIKRRYSRTLMVILGVLGCSALLTCGFGIEDTLNYGINKEVEEIIHYDVMSTYADNITHKEELMNIDNIKNVEEYCKYDVTLISKDVLNSNLYILEDEGTSFKMDYSTGAVISSKVARELDLSVGDNLTYVFNNIQYEVTISNIAELSITHGIFLSRKNSTIEYKPSGNWIECYDLNQAKLTNTANLVKDNTFIINSVSLHDYKIQIEDTIGSIRIMTMTIKIFAILLAIVVLYNLALLNLKERSRDIATLKVLGFNRFEIGRTLMIEILILTVIGSLLGLVCG